MSDPQTLEAPARTIDQLRSDGLAALQASRFDEAAEIFAEWVDREPASPEALYYHGYSLNLTGEWDKALEVLDKALKAHPGQYATHLQKALALLALDRAPLALLAVEHAVQLAPARPDALVATGRILLAMDRLGEAEAIIGKALDLAGADPEVLDAAASVLTLRGREEDAAALRTSALNNAPGYPSSLAARALALERRGRHEQALALCDRARAIAPDNFDALNIAGMVLANMKRYPEAIAAYRGAVMVRPDSAETWCSLGVASFENKQFKEADFAYYRALELKPDLQPAARNHAFTLARLSRLGAVKAFRHALDLEPDYAGLLSGLRMSKAIVCDWDDLEPLIDQARTDVERQAPVADPFEGLAFFDDGAFQRRLTEVTARHAIEQLDISPINAAPKPAGKIRVGYLSADFREHPVAQLMEPVFTGHDRSRFEIIAFSSARNDECPVQKRMREAFDEFHDVEDLDLKALATLIASRDIEILVDLTGYTQDGRVYALAWRPAPVQVNFLGYSGTFAFDAADYILADAAVIPPGSEDFYSENVVRLPHAYMPNGPRVVPDRPSRTECGLPDEGVVFCSFSPGYKITPTLFASWMRILKACPDSVLWLPDREGLEAHLPAQAQAHGVDPARLIFAPSTKTREEHFRRLQLADIMLDTFPYGAHTTASDGLWCAVPLITMAGQGFASRVAKSLLNAVDLPELVRADADDYEAFAIALAHDPDRRAALKAHLVAARETSPLFDVPRYVRNFEAALAEMSARWRRGETPASFDVVEADR